MQFNQTYQDQLQEAWQHFLAGGVDDYDYSFIRPVIFNSWLRSKEYGVNPSEKITSILNTNDVNSLCKNKGQLINTVRPYMERLYSIVEGSGYFLLLSDENGYVLDIIGDKEMIAHAKESLLVVGANRSEQIAGTNAIGTCLAIQAPIQIWNGEHYIASHRNYSCSSGPIFDEGGNLLGCLNITGRNTEIHTHTLGMVLSAVDGITKELQIRNAYEEIKVMSAQRNSILESVNSGLILINSKDQIIQMNGNAQRMLRLGGQTVIGENLNDLISLDEPGRRYNYCNLGAPFNDKETNVYFIGKNSSPIKFNISVNFVGEDSDHSRGAVVRLEEGKYINRLVNKIGGFKATYTFESMIGTSAATQRLISDCERASKSSSNVLILGESGTGKELAAQSIHNGSSYSEGPFVAINCAALPKSLIESELFGYEKGSFTGASKEGNPGKFELADGGTIFLDEVGDMPLDIQVTLLRVIQTKEVVRIGSKHPKKIDVRIIAATNRNLIDEVESKTFRQDLYYRLNVLTIHTPPLRDRDNDVCELADHFVKALNKSKNRVNKIADEVYPILQNYNWPGNVRELENVIERAISISDSDEIRSEDLPSQLFAQTHTAKVLGSSNVQNGSQTNLDYKSAGYKLIKSSLEQTNGNIKYAAELLGISRRTMYRKMDKYGIDYREYRNS